MKTENDLKQECTKQEIGEAVTFVRLELFNRDQANTKETTRILSYRTIAV